MIKFKNIGVSYGDSVIYKNFSLCAEEGKITCILGPSGCGKTTLLNVLAGLVPYTGDIEGFPSAVSYIFQEERLLPNLTVRQNLLFTAGGEKIKEADDMLKKVSLFEKAGMYPSKLSGGEKQRAAIARAFLSDAEVLLMDEPFSSLDTALKIRLTGIFASLLKERKKTVFFVTHDVEEALMLADKIIVLDNGSVKAEIVPEGSVPREYGKDSPAKNKLLSAIL